MIPAKQTKAIYGLSTPSPVALCLAVVIALYTLFSYYFLPYVDRIVRVAEQNFYFSLSGADPEVMAHSIQELRGGIELIARFYEGPGEKDLIRALHPVDFLESLAWLEASRRRLLSDKTLVHVLAYRRNLKKTAALYERSLGDLGRTLRGLGNADDVYHFIDTSTTLGDISAAVEGMEENARVVRASLFNAEFQREKADAEWKPSGVRRVLPSFARANLAFTKKFIDGQPNLNILMPVVEIPTDCFGRPGEPDLFYIVSAGNREHIVPLYSNPLFFNYASARFSQSVYYRPLADEDLDYYWQPDFNFYMCPDLTYQAEAATIYKIRELLEGISLENKTIKDFLAADLIFREEQLRLFEEIENLSMMYPEISELQDAKRLIREKSGYFGDLVGRGARVNMSLVWLTRRLPTPLKVKELLIMRSYPSLYFLPFNGSVLPADSTVRFSSVDGRSEYYEDYRKLLQIYSEEEILKIMDISLGIGRVPVK